MENFATPGNGAVCTAQYTYGTYYPANLIDGNDGSFWGMHAGYYTAWIKIDLGQTRTISRLRFKQEPNVIYTPDDYVLQYSDDDVTYTTAVERTVNGNWDETFDFTAHSARYWQIYSDSLNAQEWWAYVIELWGDAYVPPVVLDCQSTTLEVIDYVWDNYYQDTFTAIETLFPQWNYAEMDVWHISFLVFMAKKMLCCCEELSGGGGEHTPSNQQILDAVTNVDADLQSGISAIAANDNANAATIQQNDNTNASALVALINQRSADIQANDNGNTSGLIGTINAARDNVNTNTDTESSQIQSHMDVHETQAASDRATKYAATLAALTSGLAQQTLDLQGASPWDLTMLANAIAGVQADTDDIQQTLGSLPSMSGALRLWPGDDGVTYGSSVLVTAPTEINVACHGVLVTVNGFPPGQSRQPAGATTRYKGLGWLAFRSVERDYDQLEAIQFAEQVIITKQLVQADGLAVYCKPGASITVRPFLINAL